MENVNKQLLDALKRLLECYKMADHSDGYCCCGSPMDRHGDPVNCGHSAVDAGEYNASLIIEDVESIIAAAKQPPAVAVPDVDWLAQVIRAVDGNHSLGAGALAEKIIDAMLAAEKKDAK